MYFKKVVKSRWEVEVAVSVDGETMQESSMGKCANVFFEYMC